MKQNDKCTSVLSTWLHRLLMRWFGPIERGKSRV